MTLFQRLKFTRRKDNDVICLRKIRLTEVKGKERRVGKLTTSLYPEHIMTQRNSVTNLRDRQGKVMEVVG